LMACPMILASEDSLRPCSDFCSPQRGLRNMVAGYCEIRIDDSVLRRLEFVEAIRALFRVMGETRV
jgi:hypothetical protein